MAPSLLCEGPGPQEECPYKAKGRNVQVGWGDLNLCGKCNQMRILLDNNIPSDSMKSKQSTKEQSKTVLISDDATKSGKESSEEINVVNRNVSNASDTNAQKPMLLQPMLAYIVFAMQRGSIDKIKTVILSNFTEQQIIEAKDNLWRHCGTTIIGEKRCRKTTTSRTDLHAHVTDILTALLKLDKVEKLPVVVIDAMSLGMIPRSHPEELTDISLCDRLNQMELKMSNMQCALDSVIAQNLSMRERLEQVTSYSAAVKSIYGDSKVVQQESPSLPHSAAGHHKQGSSMNKSLYYAMGAIPKTSNQAVEVKDITIAGASGGKSIDDSTSRMELKLTDQTISGGRNPNEYVSQNNSKYRKTGDTQIDTHTLGTLDISVLSQSKTADNHRNCDDDDNFQRPAYVLKRERQQEAKRRRVIIGSAHSSKVQGAPEPERHLFIYRVNQSTTTDHLRAHIQNHGFTVKFLECISKPVSKFKSFKLSVPVSEFSKLFDCSIWPEGIRVRKFVTNKQDREQ